MKVVNINVNITSESCPQNADLNKCAALEFLKAQKDILQNTETNESIYFDQVNANYKLVDKKRFPLLFQVVQETCLDCRAKHAQKTR